jgi:hypothetical protein
MRQPIRISVILAYFWIMMIMLGSIVMETFMIYPTVFNDPPRSFEVALDFMRVRAPSDFFPPLGFMCWVTGAGAIVASWPTRTARYWIVAERRDDRERGDMFHGVLLAAEHDHVCRGSGRAYDGGAETDSVRVSVAAPGTRGLQRGERGIIFVGFLKFYRAHVVGTVQHLAATRL